MGPVCMLNLMEGITTSVDVKGEAATMATAPPMAGERASAVGVPISLASRA